MNQIKKTNETSEMKWQSIGNKKKIRNKKRESGKPARSWLQKIDTVHNRLRMVVTPESTMVS